MATTFSFATPVVNSTAVLLTTDLQNLALNTCKLGAAVTPGANPPLFASYVAVIKASAATVAASTVVAKCWFIGSLDGTNYDANGADSDATTNAPSRAPDFVFIWSNKASQQTQTLISTPSIVTRPPFSKYKVLFQGTLGGALTIFNDTSSSVTEYTLNEYGA